MTVHADCCGTKQAKISDMTAVLKAWSRYDGRSSAKWPKLKACLDSLQVTIQKNPIYFGTRYDTRPTHPSAFSAFSSN
jgi:hypothetical protein